MSYNDNRDSGGVVISNDVIASIAANVVKDVDGFGSFSSRPADLLSQAHFSESPRAVKVWSLDNDIKVQLFINIKSGFNIQSVCTAVQQSVKNAVQSMTGKVVSKVNVCVQGVDYCEPNELKN